MVRKKRKKKVGSTRGLGARYGSTVRRRYSKVLSEMRKPHSCPQCGSKTVQRESIGVWICRKCGLTFTGGAYTPVTKLGVVAKRAAKGLPSPEAPESLNEKEEK
jgi:large subunit ribosomal protein L37Ae